MYFIQVITTLQTTAFPVEKVPFPTVTICGSGLHMGNVEKAVADNFAKWRKEKGRNETSKTEVSRDMADYMEEVFQINNTGSPEAANILDILNTMVASDIDVDQSLGLNGVRDNVIACDATNKMDKAPEKSKSRKRRSVQGGSWDFCCEKMRLVIDLNALANLGVLFSRLAWHQSWSGEYTFFKNSDDGHPMFKNKYFHYIKIIKEGTNIKFESWCQISTGGTDCSNDGSSAGSWGSVTTGTKQFLFHATLPVDKLASFCLKTPAPSLRYNVNWFNGDHEWVNGEKNVQLICEANDFATTIPQTPIPESPQQYVKTIEKTAVNEVIENRPCIRPNISNQTSAEKTASNLVDLAAIGLPKVDIFVNPEKKEYVADIANKKKEIAKNYFDNADMEKLYPKLFQILWESTLPCLPGKRSYFSDTLYNLNL